MKTPCLLILGAIPYSNRIKSLGGVTVLMQNFLEFCRENNHPFIHVSTNRYTGKLMIVKNIIYLFIHFVLALPYCDIIMFNVTRNGMFRVFPLLMPMAKIFQKKIILRVFGGNCQFWYDTESKFWKSQATKALKRANLIFVETQQNFSFFEQFVPQSMIKQFPNVRKISQHHVHPDYQKKCVFISRIIESKGIDIILKAFDQLGGDYTVDFYGPILEKKYSSSYFFNDKIKYMGCLNPIDIRKTLAEYNLLLLPTYFEGEGYPGIIIEAMSVGLPTIATLWAGIPEIIDDKVNGILIEIKNADALCDAIQSVTEKSYQQLSMHALEKFNKYYNSDIINPKIFKYIERLM